MPGQFFSTVFSSLLLVSLLVGTVIQPALAQSATPNVDGHGPPWLPENWAFGSPTMFPGDGAWARFDGEYFPPDQKVYFLGGRGAGDATYSAVYSFDPATGIYAPTGAVMPVPVSNYDIVLLQDNTGLGMYVFGGRPSAGGTTNTVQVYYPATNTTANLTATDPWPGQAGGVPVMPNAATYNNKAYVFGGLQVSTPPYVSAETWQFDPLAPAGSRWTNLNQPLHLARGYIATAVVDAKIYAIGGDTYDGVTLTSRAIVERLDTTNLSAGWDDVGVADLPLPSSGIPGCDESRAFGFNAVSPYVGMSGTIVLAGCGQYQGGGNSALPDVFIYSESTNLWTSWPSLNQARRNHAGVLYPISRQGAAGTPGIWVFGGYLPDGHTMTTSVEYNPLTLLPPPSSVQLSRFSATSQEDTTGGMTDRLRLAVVVGGALLVALLATRQLARNRRRPQSSEIYRDQL